MISINNVSKFYGKNQILDDVSLGIKAGEFVSIMGPSGSGKSTLMHILGLLDRPTSGTYYFENQDVSQLDDDQLAKLRNQKLVLFFRPFIYYPKPLS